jgi:LmbE family N-acetylglucosaminyl deacetylase
VPLWAGRWAWWWRIRMTTRTGVAAVVALHLADPEFRFFLVHATGGEGGAIADGSGATRETLGAVRRIEDANAWRVVGRSPYRVGTAGTAGDAGAPHPMERHEQPRGHRGPAGKERLTGRHR